MSRFRSVLCRGHYSWNKTNIPFLQHNQADKFHGFQWCQPGRVTSILHPPSTTILKCKQKTAIWKLLLHIQSSEVKITRLSKCIIQVFPILPSLLTSRKMKTPIHHTKSHCEQKILPIPSHIAQNPLEAQHRICSVKHCIWRDKWVKRKWKVPNEELHTGIGVCMKLWELIPITEYCTLPSLQTNINGTKDNFELYWQDNQFGLQEKQKQIKNLPSLNYFFLCHMHEVL